jgi:hypothetical protein
MKRLEVGPRTADGGGGNKMSVRALLLLQHNTVSRGEAVC